MNGDVFVVYVWQEGRCIGERRGAVNSSGGLLAWLLVHCGPAVRPANFLDEVRRG